MNYSYFNNSYRKNYIYIDIEIQLKSLLPLPHRTWWLTLSKMSYFDEHLKNCVYDENLYYIILLEIILDN